MGVQRLRYDEIYQERLRQLEDALRAHPGQPDRYVDLAEYLIAEADNRGEKVEPRRALSSYRWQMSREQELRRAIHTLDEALRLNPTHVNALIHKAFALTALQQYDQAEKLVDQALGLAGNNPDVLRLYAKFRAMRANQLSAEAWALRQERCSSSTTTEHRSDGVYEVTRTTCYQPSQADLQRAAQLERLAEELHHKAMAAMQEAIKVTQGTVDGYLLQADLEIWAGQLDKAQSFLEQAVRLHPQSLEAQERLVDFYAKTGQQDKAEEQQAIARQLIHTTAAPMLRLAWNRILTTNWQDAKAYLMQGRQLDPEDARVLAYLGVVLTEEGKQEEATVAFRTALALEEARLQLDEPLSFRGNVLTRDALDFGLLMRVRHILAGPLMSAGHYAEALALYHANTAYAPRFAPSGRATQMFSAMLPDPYAPQIPVPAPPNGASLLAEAYLHAGKALKALGRKEEALKEFQAAAAFVRPPGTMIPKIGNARGDTNFADEAGAPAAEALLELAKNFMEGGDYDVALQYVQAATQNSPPEHLRNELNTLNREIVSKLNARLAEQQSRAYQRQQEEMNRLLQQQVERQQERDRLRQAGAAVDPDLVGIWESTPENDPSSKTPVVLVIAADGSYTITTGSSPTASTTRGRMQAWNSRMTLTDERGQTTNAAFRLLGNQFYAGAQGNDLLQITFFNGPSYRLQRRQ
jgi:tetratricopeptide (TPR) repeat protein